ncbi:MAG: hypothetical protein FWF31_10080 [Desulfobulbus sp.]|nr:hypothetical protein [Desulfobulbus sp.]
MARKAKGKTRVGLEPFHLFRRFMGAAVVKDDMEVNLIWNGPVHLPQKVEKILGQMSFACSPEDLSGQNVKGGV